MRYANIKEASEEEQQNQRTTNINYIKNFVRFKKQNFITKSTYRQIKLELNKITYKLQEKILDHFIKTIGNN